MTPPGPAYLANEAKLAANRANAGARPPREGCALCQGIIFCGSCGKPMRTSYHTDQRPSYECSSRADRLTTPTCRSVAAATVDDGVARVLLDALTPEQVALALSAADESRRSGQRGQPGPELAVERARYDGCRAERAFCAVEPENRLVARSLEARWEARLCRPRRGREALDAARESLPPLPSRADLEKLATDLPGSLARPGNQQQGPQAAAAHPDRRRDPAAQPDQAKVRIGIRWHTGATDELGAARAIHPGTAKRARSRPSRWSASLAPSRPPLS